MCTAFIAASVTMTIVFQLLLGTISLVLIGRLFRALYNWRRVAAICAAAIAIQAPLLVLLFWTQRPLHRPDAHALLSIGLQLCGVSLLASWICIIVGLRLQFARAAILAAGVTVANLVSVAAVAVSLAPILIQTFIVPTGAMAQTILGRHKDLTCPRCGFRYAVSASSEIDLPADPLLAHARQLVAATCPNCRNSMSIDPDDPSGANVPSVSGDRVMVSKINPNSPSRWDMEVFPYPDDPRTMFVKRLVGMPNEEVRIFHGDIYTRRPGGEFRIERKPSAIVRQMAEIVYDNDHPGDEAMRLAWPARWQSPKDERATWLGADDGRSFSVAAGQAESWLRYRHLAPQSADWDALRIGVDAKEPSPRLITDFAGYNSAVSRGAQGAPNGLHWVGDLLVECELSVKQADGEALFDLVEGGRHFGCAIDLKSGAARLSIDESPDFRPVGQTVLRGPGKYRLAFANVDDQLLLWIDDQLVEFDAPASYAPLDNSIPRSTPDDPGDLSPAGIGSRGAALEVRNIKLWRDVYYIATTSQTLGFDVILCDYELKGQRMDWSRIEEFFAAPEKWRAGGGEPTLFDRRREVVFPLGERQYFMLGDNSNQSKDSRLWETPFVSDTAMIGKAISIYWPNGRMRVFD